MYTEQKFIWGLQYKPGYELTPNTNKVIPHKKSESF